MKPIKTHRCKELLEYNKNNYKPCAIQYDSWGYNENPVWIIKALETDNEWCSTYMWNFAKIKYCCFCGKELNNEICEC